MLIALCEPGWEEPLATEMRTEFPNCDAQRTADGIVIAADPNQLVLAAHPSLVWARQVLPQAEALAAESIAKWGELLAQRIIVSLANHNGPWRLLLGAAVPESENVSPRRIRLIKENILAQLKRKQKRLLRTLIDPENSLENGRLENASLIQVAWQGQLALWSSLAPADVEAWLAALSFWPAGLPLIGEDKAAPARAFAKLIEAQQRLGHAIQPGETCVDLGASPGGWTHVAVNHGARVTAVDRSPLRADLMRHPDVEFLQGDAFAYEPPQPVDWLLCDVAAFPQRTLELLEQWLTRRWCRNFVVTTKFRGSEGYELLPAYKQLLRASGYEFQLRRLNANKNEMTSMGVLAS